MKLKNQVVSLELAKKIKELGFEQESYFYWANVKIENSLKEYQDIFHGQIRCGEPMEYIASAYTVAELIQELQRVAKDDIIVAYNNKIVADTLATKLIEYAQQAKI